jgi:CBS domain-containing protein
MAHLPESGPWVAGERRIYAAFAAWVRREEADLRFESDFVVPRVVGGCPGLAKGMPVVSLALRRRGILTNEGRLERECVFCPAEDRSVDLGWCRGCALAVRVDSSGVACTPDTESDPLTETMHLGGGTPVGAAMSDRHLSVRPQVRADAIALALKAEPVPAVVVVDESDRVLGTVDPSDVAQAPAEATAGDLCRECTRVDESATLADAIGAMVRAHVRFLPVIGADQRAVGLVADIDALRWVTQHRGGQG